MWSTTKTKRHCLACSLATSCSSALSVSLFVSLQLACQKASSQRAEEVVDTIACRSSKINPLSMIGGLCVAGFVTRRPPFARNYLFSISGTFFRVYAGGTRSRLMASEATAAGATVLERQRTSNKQQHSQTTMMMQQTSCSSRKKI